LEQPTTGTPAASAAAPDALPRVLVVEDNPDTLEMLSLALTMIGYEVETAADGQTALRAAAAHPPDAILCDIGLPDIDGHEVMRRLRALPGLAHTPAFALTGFGQEQDIERARAAGFDAHLTKPVDLADLDRRLREALAGAAAPVPAT